MVACQLESIGGNSRVGYPEVMVRIGALPRAHR